MVEMAEEGKHGPDQGMAEKGVGTKGRVSESSLELASSCGQQAV